MTRSSLNPSLKNPWHQTLKGLPKTFQWQWPHKVLPKFLVQENNFINFLTYLVSNRKPLSADYVLLRLIASQLEKIISFWCIIQKRKGYTKINAHTNQTMCDFILMNPRVLKSPISNDFVEVSTYGHT